MRPCLAICALTVVWAGAAPRTSVGRIPARITVLSEAGGRVDWSGANHLIAFDRRGEDGKYGLATMRPDGSGVEDLSHRFADLSGRDCGQPAWSPSGRYLLFQLEKRSHLPVRPVLTSPGAGWFNDLWVLDLQTSRRTLLREVESDKGHGILHPHFSADGTQVSWSEMFEGADVFSRGDEFGHWALEVGRFAEGPSGPELRAVQAYQPLGPAFYENHGFNPEGSRLIFTSNARRPGESAFKGEDIFTLDLRTGEVRQLTADHYNEHALFSPDGKWIVWMSNRGDATGGAAERTGTDYWIMRADGSDKRQVTFFNRPGHPHAQGQTTISADFSWRSDSLAFAAYTHSRLGWSTREVRERVLLVELDPAWLEGDR